MRSLILGTAGHIDHGKTALVRALTGVDTDRLKEEKERGITVDLGFAELVLADHDLRFGIVDVPGHEGFIRNMLAGATGMDLVLLVVAADEGIMPQTREHLSIVQLLGVRRLVVALAKSDLVEADWSELVVEDVRETLLETPYADAPILPVSSVTGEGLEELRRALGAVGSEAEAKQSEDVARLPVDRVFTIRGAGTIVTGSLWTGTLRAGDRVSVLPGNLEARVRSLQLHGQDVEEARAGARVAVGLTGTGISHQTLVRGQTLVTGSGWVTSRMLDARLRVLPDTGWALEQGQRVRVHLGTAEVLARVVLLEADDLASGEEGWAQLRLEKPLLARGRDHLVIRSYSPVTTIAGGRVAEVDPDKRRRLESGEGKRLDARTGADAGPALRALIESRGWRGVSVLALPQLLGFPTDVITGALGELTGSGGCIRLDDLLVGAGTWDRARSRIRETLAGFHEAEPLKPGMPLQELRQSLPRSAARALGEAALQSVVDDGLIRLLKGLAAQTGFSPVLNREQESLRERIRGRLRESGLAVPGPAEMAETFRASLDEVRGILRLMEAQGEVVSLEGDLFLPRTAVAEAGAALVEAFGGETGLGPADFKAVLGVSRKFLLPLLRHLDTLGITTRVDEDRAVAQTLPEGWGT
jgi:selenocysteine-specific elongation factor